MARAFLPILAHSTPFLSHMDNFPGLQGYYITDMKKESSGGRSLRRDVVPVQSRRQTRRIPAHRPIRMRVQRAGATNLPGQSEQLRDVDRSPPSYQMW